MIDSKNKFKLEICSLKELPSKKNATHLISLIENGYNIPLGNMKNLIRYLKLPLIDTDYPFVTNNDAEHAPRKTDVFNIIKFGIQALEDLKTQDVNLVIHCYAGIARSTAAALAIIYHIKKDITKSIDILSKLRPQANPNKLMVKYIDEIYSCNNNLINAVREHFGTMRH